MKNNRRPPIRVLQFGTGRLLRGLCADAFDRANADADVPWEGSVAAVQSTGSHRADLINERDGRFSLRVQGLIAGREMESTRENGVITRAFSADRDWPAVRTLARSPDLDLIISNTTEAGLQDPSAADDLAASTPPPSFVGKLLAVLVERFDAHPDRALTVVPCELIESNGRILRNAVLGHADRCAIDPDAAAWISTRVRFADSLVDRICTSPGVDADPLDTVVEPYALWAIRDQDGAAGPLAFAAATGSTHECTGRAGASVHADIGPFYGRKVRVLNGAHIAVVHLGLLAGLETVVDVMHTGETRRFLDALLQREILPALTHDGIEDGPAFAADVVDRFANPHLAHALAEIEKGSAQKVGIRLGPTSIAHAARTGSAPGLIALSLAAWSERTRREYDRDRNADAVLGTKKHESLAALNDSPAVFAEAMFATVAESFGGAIRAGLIGQQAALLAGSGARAAIDHAVG